MFGAGWSKFVKEAGIHTGDICVFECIGNRLQFNICIERQEDHDFITVNPGDVVFSFFFLSIQVILCFFFVFFCVQIFAVGNSFKLYSLNHWSKIEL